MIYGLFLNAGFWKLWLSRLALSAVESALGRPKVPDAGEPWLIFFASTTGALVSISGKAQRIWILHTRTLAGTVIEPLYGIPCAF